MGGHVRPDARLTGVLQRHARSRARTIELDGEPWRTTSIEAWSQVEIPEGETVDPDELVSRLGAVEPDACRARALRLIDARDRSRGELEARLLEDGYPAETVTATVERFVEVGLVDDDRLAAALVRSLAEVKGYGHHRIRRDLMQRRLDEAVVERVLAGLADSGTEDDRALEAARRACRSCRDPDKLAQRLVRRGFAWELARRAASSALDECGDDPA